MLGFLPTTCEKVSGGLHQKLDGLCWGPSASVGVNCQSCMVPGITPLTQQRVAWVCYQITQGSKACLLSCIPLLKHGLLGTRWSHKGNTEDLRRDRPKATSLASNSTLRAEGGSHLHRDGSSYIYSQPSFGWHLLQHPRVPHWSRPWSTLLVKSS